MENYNGYKIELVHDDSAESPREWDNLGTIVTTDNRYFSLQEKSSYDLEDLKLAYSDPDLDSAPQDIAAILPIYMYAHSGVTISTSNSNYPFTDRWDAGQVGFIYITEEKVKHEGIDPEKVATYLRGEIDTLDQWLRGDVWGYRVLDQNDNEIESCWGFFGDEVATQEARSVIDHLRANDYEVQQEAITFGE